MARPVLYLLAAFIYIINSAHLQTVCFVCPYFPLIRVTTAEILRYFFGLKLSETTALARHGILCGYSSFPVCLQITRHRPPAVGFLHRYCCYRWFNYWLVTAGSSMKRFFIQVSCNVLLLLWNISCPANYGCNGQIRCTIIRSSVLHQFQWVVP
jgi:hypothetical protein